MDKMASKKGFTIIEVTLVLAITGLLTVSILIGVQFAINNQRYNDSVNSFKSFLQSQYASVSTPNIQKENRTVECGTENRGRTECVVLGRLLTIDTNPSNNLTKISIKKILGKNIFSDTELRQKTDFELVTNKDYIIEGESEGESYLEWDALLKNPSNKNPYFAKIMIIKSPLSGSIVTYSTNNLSKKINEIASSDQNKLEMCVYPNGIIGLVKRAVILNPYGSDASAVDIAPVDGVVNGVQPVKC